MAHCVGIGGLYEPSYTSIMSLIKRTAGISVRVPAEIKEHVGRVLHRIGLNMSEAVELFLRRVIIEERIPFDVSGLDIESLRAQVNLSDHTIVQQQKKNSGILLRVSRHAKHRRQSE